MFARKERKPNMCWYFIFFHAIWKRSEDIICSLKHAHQAFSWRKRGRQLLKWPLTTPASWLPCHFVILSFWMWVGLNDFLPTNKIWQKCWDVTVKIRLQKTLFSILFTLFHCLPLLLWGKPAAMSWDAPWRGPHGKELMSLANSQQGPAACQQLCSELQSGTSEACQQLYVLKQTLPLPSLERTAALGSSMTCMMTRKLCEMLWARKSSLATPKILNYGKCQILNVCHVKPPNLRAICRGSSNLRP